MARLAEMTEIGRQIGRSEEDPVDAVNGGDLFINPDRPWPELESLDRKLRAKDIALRLRMPIYDEFIEAGWCPEAARPALDNQLALRAEAGAVSEAGAAARVL